MKTWPLVRHTVASFFKISPETVLLKTTADDIPDWDSFSHMELITAIENQFQINIPFDVLMDFNSLEDLVQYIDNQV